MSKRSADPDSPPGSTAGSPKKAKLDAPSVTPATSNDGSLGLVYGPACPGIVKTRPPVQLERLPSDSDAFAAFAKLRADKNLSDEEAFLELLKSYDLSLATLSRISAQKLDVSFSNVTYQQVAPYVWLDPDRLGSDMLPLEIFRSRIPNYLFMEILSDVDLAEKQYGPMANHDNEEARSRFIASLFNRIVSLFGSAITNKPEGLLESKFSRRGRIEHHFISVGLISIVFIEVKRELNTGRVRDDVIAQVLAECAACDYANQKQGQWAPILAILCDGEHFRFFVMDSAEKVIFSSGGMAGVPIEPETKTRLLAAIKKTTERLFDWFLMAYINGIRAFSHRSTCQSRVRKRDSTDQWSTALSDAERALRLLREADSLADSREWRDAESTAAEGVLFLRKSVLELPSAKVVYEGLTDGCYWPVCMEESLSKESGDVHFR
ncbi:hypothetical protein BJY04DRAFT_196918 [Aspergillus karnatakaensis]|uniref:uncharacterized protein n=1 Tax=Aspergillus karnatakaensis TaxID=1810916 RepID=UPI003CCCA169